jgi:hypothetical protein
MIHGRAHYDYLERGSLTSGSIGAPKRNPPDPLSSYMPAGAATVALNRPYALKHVTLCAQLWKTNASFRGPHRPSETLIPVIFCALLNLRGSWRP